MSSDGTLRGAVGPVEVRLPWWQETLPVADVLPGSQVLRLLNAEHDETGDMGGRVTYLVAHDGPIPAPLALGPWLEPLDDHPNRMPWARIGGPSADLDWASTVVTLDSDRAPRQHRTWNLSAIWSVPVEADERSRGHDEVWLKCVPPFFAHEAAILELMADRSVPRLIAADGHRLLLEPMPGSDGYGPNAAEEPAMVDSLVDLQVASNNRIDELIAAGVPDLRTGALIGELTALVQRVAADDPLLCGFVETLPDRMARLDGLGLGDVLGHGDPHAGNCRRGTDPVLWFDWGDGFIGHPLLDVAADHRLSAGAVDHWLGRWAERASIDAGALFDLWRLAEPVSRLRMAWVYQRFCDNIEQAELVYHRNDVAEALDRTRRALVVTDI